MIDAGKALADVCEVIAGAARELGTSLARLASWSAAAYLLGSLVFFRLQRHLADEV